MYTHEQCQADFQQLMAQLLGQASLPALALEDFAFEHQCIQARLRLPWPIGPALWAEFKAMAAAFRPEWSWALQYVCKPKARAILATQQSLPGVKNVIGIAAGKGGVGKSTVAVGVAKALCRGGARVGLLDADIYGPSAPVLLGISDQKTTTKDKKFIPIEVSGLKVQSMATLVAADDALIWRGPMASKAVEQLAYQTLWGDLDYLVVDLPPGTGDIALTVTKKLPLTAAVLVSTAHPLALADVYRCHAMLQKMQIPMLGVVDNMAYVSCEKCNHHQPLFKAQAALKQWSAAHELASLESLPFASEGPSELLFDKLAAQMAAGLCYLPVRHGVRIPQVVSV